MNIDSGTKNKAVKGFVRYTVGSATISAGVTLLISIILLLVLPFTSKFPLIWPASGLALASLISSKKKLFVYSAGIHTAAMVLARGFVLGNWFSALLVSALEIANVIAIVFLLRNLGGNRYIFTSVRKVSHFLIVTALMSIFTGIFSMFIPPFQWENQISMEWATWLISIVPSYWVVASLVLSYYRKFERIDMTGTLKKHLRRNDPAEIGYALMISITTMVILFNFSFSFTTSIILLMFAVPLMLFAAVRFQSLPFMILLTVIGESAIIHAYLYHRSFFPTHPLELAPLFTTKLIFLIFSGALIVISVLFLHLSDQKGLVYRSRGEFAANFLDSHVGMFHTDDAGVVLRANKTLANLLGYDTVDELHSSLVANPSCLFFGPEDLAAFTNLARTDLGWVDAPLTLRAKSGKPVEVELAGRPWMEDRLRVFIEVIVTDLSKVMVLNQRLAVLEERLRLATDVSSIGVWEVNLTSNQLHANSVLDRWFGRATTDLAQDLADIGAMFDPAIYPTVNKIFQSATAGEIDTFEFEARALSKDSGWRVYKFFGKHLTEENNNLLDRWIGTIWDVTEEYDQRVRLSQANEKLHAESVENRKLRDVIAKHSVRDLVTGLYTSNYLQELHQTMVTNSLSTGLGHTLIIIEIRDGSTLIKSIGFDRAQKMIKLLGELTRQHFRATDHIGRLSTFMIGIITDLTDTDGIRERLVRIMTDFEFAMVTEINQSLHLRSAVATYPIHGEGWSELLAQAEQTLS